MTTPRATANTAFSQYKHNFVADMQALCAVWIPLHYANFRFVPLHLRIPFMAVAGSGYAMLLSYMRGAAPDDDNEKINE